MGKLEAEERHGAQKIKLVLVSRYMQKKDEKKKMPQFVRVGVTIKALKR